MDSNICLVLILIPDLSCCNDHRVPYKFAQADKRLEPLTRCYVTSNWQWWISQRQTHETIEIAPRPCAVLRIQSNLLTSRYNCHLGHRGGHYETEGLWYTFGKRVQLLYFIDIMKVLFRPRLNPISSHLGRKSLPNCRNIIPQNLPLRKKSSPVRPP